MPLEVNRLLAELYCLLNDFDARFGPVSFPLQCHCSWRVHFVPERLERLRLEIRWRTKKAKKRLHWFRLHPRSVVFVSRSQLQGSSSAPP